MTQGKETKGKTENINKLELLAELHPNLLLQSQFFWAHLQLGSLE